MTEKILHTLPDLPYAYGGLEPFIDEATMKLHHDKHHAAYIKNLNDALEKHPELFLKTAEELLLDLNNIPDDIKAAVRNNGGGHVNHTMFWQIMAPQAGGLPAQAGQPSGKLAEEITKYFGSFADFQTKFNEAGTKRFGSGWVWLVKDTEGKLDIISTANQDNPMSEGLFPVMGNDVWEHAYYLTYKNVRADYLKAWWSVVNWKEVEKRFNA